MAKVHGKNTYISVGGDDISQYVNASEFNPTVDSHDVTGYGSDGHVYAGGLTDGTFSLSGVYDSDAGTGPRAVLAPLSKADAGTVEIIRQPEGAGASKPQDVFQALCTSYTESNPVADMVTFAAEFQISGDVDSTAQSA